MAEFSIKDGMRAYVEDMEREIKEGWGKWLTDDERQGVMDALAAFAEEEEAFMETVWGPENQERLEHQIRELVDDLIKDAKSQANNSGASDDFDEMDLFDRIKITVYDGPDDNPGSYTLTAEIEENHPSANEDASVEFTIETADMHYRLSYPRQELDDDEVDDDDIWREKEIGSNAYDELIRDGPEFEDQSGCLSAMYEAMNDNTVAHFQPGPQQGEGSHMTDHILDDADADGSPLVPCQEGWVHGLGEDVMESIEEDASVAHYDNVIEHALIQDSNAACVAGPSNYQEMVQTDDNCSAHDSSSDDILSGAVFRQTDEEDVEDEEYPDCVNDPKGKQPENGEHLAYSEHYRHKDNHLWHVVVDADNPGGPPAGYICKFTSCKGRQGKWASRKSHYEAKHPEEWFAFTGKRQRVYKCLVDGCGWTTMTGKWYLRVHMKDKHGLSEEQ